MFPALKLVIGLWLVVSSLFLTTQPLLAQTTTPSASASATIKPIGIVTPESPHFVNLQVINLMHSFSCLISGISPLGQPCISFMGNIPVLSSVNTSGGVTGTITLALGALYSNPPVNSVKYLGSVWDSINPVPVKPAYAQVGGSGSQILDPILTLWQTSRNITYVVMIIIFVVIGVMVMFRSRINPQTVITIQAALPGLVIGLILITFSYFIASLITDVTFVGSNLVGHYFTLAQNQSITTPGGAPNNPVQILRDENVLSIMSRFLNTNTKKHTIPLFETIYDNLPAGSPVDIFNPGTLVRYAVIGLTLQLVNLLGLPPPISGPISAYVTVEGIANPAPVGSFFVFLVLVLVLVYSMFRVLYRLVVSYLTIIFLTVTAPFVFLMAAFPGRQGVFVSWARNMLANVLAFPGVLAMFYFAGYLMGPRMLMDAGGAGGITLDNLLNISQQLNVTGVTLPGRPLPPTLPLLGGLETSTIQLVLAYGALIAAPAIPEIIINTITKPGPAGQILGREVTGAVQSGRGFLQQGAGAVGGVFRGRRP